MIIQTVRVEELVLIILLSAPIIIWGFRHGLDAVIIAVIGALAGMALADTLASGTVTIVNSTWKMMNAFIDPGFGDPEFFNKMRTGPGLIETPEHVILAGTIVFMAIAYVSFRIAFKRAGGRKNILEGVFGALGAAVTGYLIANFLITRHVRLPLIVEVTETTPLPSFSLDANVVVLIALVIVVFAVQSTRGKKK